MSNTIKNASVIVSEDYSSYNQTEQSSSQRSQHLKKAIKNLSVTFIVANLIVLPFLFGGVHEQSYLTFHAISFLLLALIVGFQYKNLSRALSLNSKPGKVFLSLAILLLFLSAHAALFYIQTTSHPVLGNVSILLNPKVAANIVLEFANFLSIFVISLYWLNFGNSNSRRQRYSFISNTIIFSAFLVSLTALSHWFYDNGKLFWTFAANTESTSTRARWPFVNPNHLGIFLIIPLFLAISKIDQAFADLKIATRELRRKGRLVLSDLITDRQSQNISRNIILLSLFVLTIGLAIIASLSRNAITSSFLCLLMFFLFSGKKQKSLTPYKPISDSDEEVMESTLISFDGKIKKKSRRRSSRQTSDRSSNLDISKIIPALKLSWKILLITGSIAVFWFFLGEKGGELFRSRLEFALIYTQDDMRWQLYKDSIPMILSSPFFGIGLGNWSALYPQFMAEGLSGMEPGYLHSDLFQTAIELGLLGFLVFLTVIIYTSKLILFQQSSNPKTAKNADAIENWHSKAMFYGFLAVFFSAAFEFPLRIPAIVAICAISLALELFSLDLNNKNNTTL